MKVARWIGAGRVTAVAAQIDTPRQRAQLAALTRLRDQHRINSRRGAAASRDPDSRSDRFIGAGLLQAGAISVGADHTPGDLHLAA
jgi:hypothetical protein